MNEIDVKKQEEDFWKAGFDVGEQDIVLLESLIKSPVYASLKRLLDGYKNQCYSALLTATETSRIFQIQGRLLGIKVVENLPELMVKRRNDMLKKKAEEEKRPKPAPLPGREKPTL